MVADRDGGNLPVLPFSGGFLEQPYKTMQVFSVCQDLFRLKLKEEADALRASAGGR